MQCITGKGPVLLLALNGAHRFLHHFVCAEHVLVAHTCSAWMSGTDADRAAASGEPASSSARATSCCSRSGSISPFQARLHMTSISFWKCSRRRRGK